MKLCDEVLNSLNRINEKGINISRVKNVGGVQVTEKEGKRLSKLGVEIPPIGKSGPIIFKGKKVGSASGFSGILFTDKDFITEYVKDVLWYVN
jgi:hypothetical protein